MTMRTAGRRPGSTARTPGVLVLGLALVVVAALTACSKGPDTTASTGTSLQGPVVLPSTAAGPGTTTATTLPEAAQLPTGTEWPASPDPCALVTETDVRTVTRFNVTSLNRPGKSTNGVPTKVCLFKNQTADIEGGSLTVSIVPPGTDVGGDLSSLTDVQRPTDIGVKAIAGHLKANPTGGQGTNIVTVDMGNGGFSIGVFVFADTDNQAVLDLARLAAKNWKVAPK